LFHFSYQTLPDEDSWFEFLKSNFERHYLGNRAPFPIYLDAQWIRNPSVDKLNLVNR
jgi:hypothetical protein